MTSPPWQRPAARPSSTTPNADPYPAGFQRDLHRLRAGSPHRLAWPPPYQPFANHRAPIVGHPPTSPKSCGAQMTLPKLLQFTGGKASDTEPIVQHIYPAPADTRFAELYKQIEDLRADRDAWREQAQRLALPAPRRRWWWSRANAI